MSRIAASTIVHNAMRAATWAYTQFKSSDTPRNGFRVLMYHAIGTPIKGDTRALYNMSFDVFEGHMRHLSQHWREVLVPLNLSELRGDAVRIAVTFDDGYLDNLRVAAPLLVHLGIPFTVFICTGPVVQRQAGFLGPEEVRELAGLPGVQIGSHSINHLRLTECNDQQLHSELSGSKSYLEDLLGWEINLLSYPHGAVDCRVRDVAENIGYVIGGSSRFDVNQGQRDPLFLCRTDIWACDNEEIFNQKIKGDWDWNRWRYADPAQVD